MHIYKNVSFTAIIMAFTLLFSACAERKQKAVNPPTAPAKTAKVKSAMDLVCDEYTDGESKAACYLAQSREMAKKAKAVQKAAVSVEPSEMQKSRKIIASDKRKQEKAEREQREAQSKVSGCEAGSFWIDPSVTRLALGFVNAKFVVTNMSPTSIVIRDDQKGRDVAGLCPGGRTTLVKLRPLWLDGDQTQVSYTAYGTIGGRPAIQHSQQVTLTIYQAQYQPTQLVQWDVHLQVQ